MENNKNEEQHFLSAEVERLHRSTKRAYTVGVIIALLMTGYLGFIYTSFSRMLDPEELSPIVLNQGQMLAENLINTYSEDLKEYAPALADETSRRITEDLIPAVGLFARDQINTVHVEAIPYIDQEVASFFETYFAANQEELRLLSELAEHDGAEVFVRTMIAEFATQVDSVMEASSPDAMTLGEWEEGLEVTLLAADETLANLLAKEPEEMTRKERLQSQILANLTALLLERI
ncbi:MAG: hypothetical protein JJT75_04655 [Opitutales bacterium]|nr:hypothetical protein [Opitutales bacterium]MCH8540435.1 hypothetical protein [Opitutales bacterium]